MPSREPEQSEQFRLPIDRLNLAYIVWDPRLIALVWNKKAEEIFGYTAEEILGRSGLEMIVPSDAKEVVKQVMKKLQVGDMNAHSINENVTKDGRTIICEWYNT